VSPKSTIDMANKKRSSFARTWHKCCKEYVCTGECIFMYGIHLYMHTYINMHVYSHVYVDVDVYTHINLCVDRYIIF
jgi:hypothetical protein